MIKYQTEIVSPLVSVVIPAFNSAKFIATAIDSALNQTFKDFEIIVIDDGSVDETRNVVARYGEAGLVKYYYQNNAGPASARNNAIEKATGQLIAFLDSDDTWHHNKLELQVEFMSNNPHFAMSFTDMLLTANGQVVHKSYLRDKDYKWLGQGWIYENILHENFIFPSTVIIRSDVIKSLGCFDDSLKIAEDRDLWLRIAEKYQIGFMDAVLTTRNNHDSNITLDGELFSSSLLNMFEKHHERRADENSESGRMHLIAIRNQLSKRYFELGCHHLRQLQPIEARSAFSNCRKYGGTDRLWFRDMLCSMPPCLLKVIKNLKNVVTHSH